MKGQMTMKDRHYTDLFVDFDDTLCDTHGNAVEALHEVYDEYHLERCFSHPDIFHNAYWEANIDLWQRYGRGEITRDYLIVERFRRPLSQGRDINVTPDLCLQMSDRFRRRAWWRVPTSWWTICAGVAIAFTSVPTASMRCSIGRFMPVASTDASIPSS